MKRIFWRRAQVLIPVAVLFVGHFGDWTFPVAIALLYCGGSWLGEMKRAEKAVTYLTTLGAREEVAEAVQDAPEEVREEIVNGLGGPRSAREAVQLLHLHEEIESL